MLDKRARLNALRVKSTTKASSERTSAEAPVAVYKPTSLPEESEFEPDSENQDDDTIAGPRQSYSEKRVGIEFSKRRKLSNTTPTHATDESEPMQDSEDSLTEASDSDEDISTAPTLAEMATPTA